MKKYVITRNEIVGTHRWEDAPEEVFYLRDTHRHNFIFICEFAVEDSDREIEIIQKQDEIEAYIEKKHGKPAIFGTLSCEMIAEEILHNFKECESCTVLEDGYGGAKVMR